MSGDLSLVVPVYNEEENIKSLLEELDDWSSGLDRDVEIIIVDDGSTDSSANLIRENKFSDLRLVSHEENKGYGEALKTGFSESDNELVGYIDGDLQFDIEDLGSFLDLVEDFDLVVGERVDRKDNLDRILISRVFNWLVRVSLNLNVRDVNCGMKLMRKKVLDNIELRTRRTVDAELIAKANKKGMSIKQVPVTHLARNFGKSEATGLFSVRISLIVTTVKELKLIYEDFN